MIFKILPLLYFVHDRLRLKASLRWGVSLFAVLWLSACSSELITPTASPTAWEGILATAGLPLTASPSPSTFLTASETPAPSPTLTLTATPVLITYKVAKNDDMFGIALRFGISPQMLMTANPSVNPRAMGVGTVLVIPVTPAPGGKTPAPQKTPSTQETPSQPAVNALASPVCYPAGDGGLWCFWLLQSSASQGVENVTGSIQLVQAGKAPLDQPATTPLDIIPAGESLPLEAYFPPPVSTSWTATGKIASYLPLPKDNPRYLPVTVRNQVITPLVGQNSVIVKGELGLGGGNQTAQTIRLAATAFDANGVVEGLRVWDSPGPLAVGAVMPYEFQVDSLGQGIAQVTIVVEARP